MRDCRKCGESRSLDRFGINKHGNLNGTCKNCEAKAKREKYHANPDARRRLLDNQARWRYNISLDEYQGLLDSQGGRCAICGDVPGERKFAVDHDHACCPGQTSCGECIRGLLCSRCNSGLGMFRDNAAYLESAADYLRSNDGF